MPESDDVIVEATVDLRRVQRTPSEVSQAVDALLELITAKVPDEIEGEENRRQARLSIAMQDCCNSELVKDGYGLTIAMQALASTFGVLLSHTSQEQRMQAVTLVVHSALAAASMIDESHVPDDPTQVQ